MRAEFIVWEFLGGEFVFRFGHFLFISASRTNETFGEDLLVMKSANPMPFPLTIFTRFKWLIINLIVLQLLEFGLNGKIETIHLIY